MRTSLVYDKMASGYLTKGRLSTTALFREIQKIPLRKCLRIARDNIGWYSGMKYLVVGPGPCGNTEVLFGLHRCIGPYLDEINPADITYIDTSHVMLTLCRNHVKRQSDLLYKQPNAGQFIQGQAETLERQIEYESQDIILGALCDHLEQKDFFSSCMDTLRPGGALITSYPSDGINRVVREKIYKINPSHTRFVINGEIYLVRSCLMETGSLEKLYKKHGYVNIQTFAVSSPTQTSATMQRAADIANLNPKTEPPIIVGVGFKEV